MFKKELMVALLLMSGCVPHLPHTYHHEIIYHQVATHKPYDAVLADLKIAISEHNFRITGHNRVGKIIRDRGTAHFPEYDTLQFCNLSHAKTLLLLSPHAVIYMPCNIVIYQFNQQVIIKTKLLPTTTDNPALNQFATKMNDALKQMIAFAVEQ